MYTIKWCSSVYICHNLNNVVTRNNKCQFNARCGALKPLQHVDHKIMSLKAFPFVYSFHASQTVEMKAEFKLRTLRFCVTLRFTLRNLRYVTLKIGRQH